MDEEDAEAAEAAAGAADADAARGLLHSADWSFRLPPCCCCCCVVASASCFLFHLILCASLWVSASDLPPVLCCLVLVWHGASQHEDTSIQLFHLALNPM